MPFIHVRLTQNHMATTFDLCIACAPNQVAASRQVLGECHQAISTLEGELSEYLPESPIYQLNHASPRNWVSLTPHAQWLLQESFEIERISQGAFSCLAKSSADSSRKIEIYDGLACREDEGVHVGFGAIGKGYALDHCRRLIEQAGFQNYCLNAGGSSVCLSGFSDEKRPWSWGWSWKKENQEPVGLRLQHVSGEKVAIGVSGTQEKGGHILGRDGKSVDTVESALVAHRSASHADALSTALFVGGWQSARENFSKLTEPPAMAVIEKNQIPHWNGLFQNLWGIVGTLLLSLSAFAEEDVDLDALGMDDFTPYIVSRNDLWILLPLFILLLVAIHLKDSRPNRKRPITPLEDQTDDAQS